MSWALAGARIVVWAIVLTSIGACEAARVFTVGPGPNCPKAQVEAVLHVDPADPRQVWATDLATEEVLPEPNRGAT
ncbi:MAG: hypothetical protein M0Z49_09935 [Chloroflexi bacterium]|nr:hypothetical protein [Chloroflexota bacterium]